MKIKENLLFSQFLWFFFIIDYFFLHNYNRGKIDFPSLVCNFLIFLKTILTPRVKDAHEFVPEDHRVCYVSPSDDIRWLAFLLLSLVISQQISAICMYSFSDNLTIGLVRKILEGVIKPCSHVFKFLSIFHVISQQNLKFRMHLFSDITNGLVRYGAQSA